MVWLLDVRCVVFLFQAEDGIRDLVRSRGLGDVYKRQAVVAEGSNLPMVQADDPAQPGPSLDAPVAIPDNPGVLVKNNRQMLLELKVDPQTFTDRTGFVLSLIHI